MSDVKYFLKNNYGKIMVFVAGSAIMTGLYVLTQNFKAVLN